MRNANESKMDNNAILSEVEVRHSKTKAFFGLVVCIAFLFVVVWCLLRKGDFGGWFMLALTLLSTLGFAFRLWTKTPALTFAEDRLVDHADNQEVLWGEIINMRLKIELESGNLFSRDATLVLTVLREGRQQDIDVDLNGLTESPERVVQRVETYVNGYSHKLKS